MRLFSRIDRMRCFVMGVASAMLATPTFVSAQSTSDSLGLRAFNALAQVIPGEISMDARLRSMQRRAPGLRLAMFGVMHGAFDPPSRTDGIHSSFLFHADSGALLFDRRLSANSVFSAFESYLYGSDVNLLNNFLRAVNGAASALGPPQFCDRDTVTRETARAIDIGARATWRRGGIEVLISENLNLRKVMPPYEHRAQRFSVSYDVFRFADPLVRRDGATRHDSPCLLSETEWREHAIPLDSAAYDSLRTELLKRPETDARRTRLPR